MKKTIIFPAFKTNENGIWYFCTDKVNDFKKNKPCKGFGQIKYPEGSIYTGEIYYDGVNFNKLGYGQQDFSCSDLGGIDPFINERKYKYVGQYDYRKTDWIYGNGVFYYKDINGKPSHFVKGFYKGTEKIKEYQGEFDYSNLLSNYTKEMEFDYVQRLALFNHEKENLNKISKLTTLFIGDSYFEFWHYKDYAGKLFYESFKDYSLNLGLGGSTFSDWFNFVDKLKDIPPMKNIIINLGFNDLHSNLSSRVVYLHGLKLLKLLRNYFPNSNYYLINVVHAPLFDKYLEQEIMYNTLIDKYCEKHNFKVLDNYSLIKDSKENCFHKDLIHLNSKGYEILYDLIEKEVDL